MAVTFIRTMILYVLVIFGLRVMGKRQIGEMQPSELVVAIMISDLATIPMQELGIPLLSGIIPIFTLVILEITLSQISLKNKHIRKFVSGKPNVVVYEGKILKDEMKNIRFNNDDLLEQLRIQGYQRLEDIQYAILETNGQLSVFPKKDKATCTVEDVKNIVKGQKK